LALFIVYCYLLLRRHSQKLGVAKGELAPKGQKLRPKAENKGGLLGEKPVAGAQPRKQKLFGAWKPPKMHTLSINFISFTAEMLGKKATLASWGAMASPLNPPMRPRSGRWAIQTAQVLCRF